MGRGQGEGAGGREGSGTGVGHWMELGWLCPGRGPLALHCPGGRWERACLHAALHNPPSSQPRPSMIPAAHKRCWQLPPPGPKSCCFAITAVALSVSLVIIFLLVQAAARADQRGAFQRGCGEAPCPVRFSFLANLAPLLRTACLSQAHPGTNKGHRRVLVMVSACLTA